MLFLILNETFATHTEKKIFEKKYRAEITYSE